MRDLVFWGATGQAKVLYEAIRGTDMRLAVLVDNRELSPTLLGVQVLHGVTGLDGWLARREHSSTLYFTVAVGGGHGRDRLMLMDLLQGRGLRPISIVHRTAFVAHNAVLGDGCQVLAQAAVCADARLGRGVIVNTSASVDHDCQVGDGVHLGPGARLAGEISVGARTFVGTSAVVLPRIRIGDDVTVGAGAVVTRDVPAGHTVVGNPARILEK
jgi:sugar O-acyltransferase (sialic acid O-acetyltransferase NeuD family)